MDQFSALTVIVLMVLSFGIGMMAGHSLWGDNDET